MPSYHESDFFDEFLPYLLVLLVVSLLLYLFLFFFNAGAYRTSSQKSKIDFLGRPIAERSSERAKIIMKKQKLLLESRQDRLRDQKSLSDLRRPLRQSDI
ncbi:MAG: hypothetical protein WC450_10745 [Candidatus Omnitrophota bacterium]|jgi:hypothetical protein